MRTASLDEDERGQGRVHFINATAQIGAVPEDAGSKPEQRVDAATSLRTHVMICRRGA
jgi:hypothetical protein